MNNLEAQLGFKGERGDSAYEIAVQNGYEGTEAEWADSFLNSDNYYNKSEVKGLVIDNLTSETTDQPLSAKQGKVLKGLIDEKADGSTTYSKAEINSLLNDKADTSDVIIKDNIVCIFHKFTIPASTTYYTGQIAFPNGFSKKNCVILSTMVKGGVSTSWSTPDVFGYDTQVGSPKFFVTLGGGSDSDLITIEHDIGSHSNDLTINLKIVLMKVDPDVSNYELGDINMDGELDSDDLTLIYNYIQGTQPLIDKQFKLADMNEDNEVTYLDYTALYNKINNNS